MNESQHNTSAEPGRTSRSPDSLTSREIRQAGVVRVLVVEGVANLLVAACKITIGALASNLTVLSDGMHGLLDAANNVAGYFGLKFSYRPPDADHPYGHRKVEALLALGIGAVMALTSWEILQAVARRFLSETPFLPKPFNPLFVIVLFATLAVNAAVVSYQLRMGRKLKSAFLIADAGHTKTHMALDVMAIASLVLASRFAWIDPVLSLVVVGYILRMGFHIVWENAMILTDTEILDPKVVKQAVESIPDVLNCHAIRSHGMPDDINLDLHIVISPDLTAGDASEIETRVRKALFEKFAEVTEVAIHHQTHSPMTFEPERRDKFEARD